MMCRICCQRLAPSTSLAWNSVFGIAWSAEEKISIPIDAPTKPLIRMTKTHAFTPESSSQLREWMPNWPRNMLRNPVSQVSHFQSST